MREALKGVLSEKQDFLAKMRWSEKKWNYRRKFYKVCAQVVIGTWRLRLFSFRL